MSIQSRDDISDNPYEGIAKDAALVTDRGNIISEDGVVYSSNGSDDSLSGNVFSDPEVAAYYKDLYEKSKYECREVFDPKATWSEEEEKKIIRKLDIRVCFWACTMFFALQVDRGNLVQAVSSSFLKDLGLTTNGSFNSTFHGCSSIMLTSENRLQLGKYRISLLLPARRAALSARIQKVRS